MKTMKKIKPIGMIHIPGKNDKEWAEFIKNVKPKVEQVMITIVDNRW